MPEPAPKPLPKRLPGNRRLASTMRSGRPVAPKVCGPLRPPPARWRAGLAGVLIPERQLDRRVREMAAELERDYAGKELVVVALLTGTVMFLADLLRRLALPLRLDFLGVSSYRDGTRAGKLVFTKNLRLDVRDRDVLLVDDILDSGQTLHRVLDRLRALQPRSLRTCVLLDKPARRRVQVRADYVGFVIPDVFVVGYGLDYAERHRNLPFVAVLETTGSGSP